MEFMTADYLSNCQDGKPFEAVTSDHDGFLENYVDLLEVTCHEVFSLHCLALQSEFIDKVEFSVFVFETNQAINVTFLDKNMRGEIFEKF